MRAAERDAKVAAAAARQVAELWDTVMLGDGRHPPALHRAIDKAHRRFHKLTARGLGRPLICTSDRHRPDWNGHVTVRKVTVVDRPGTGDPYEAYWCERCIKIHHLEIAIDHHKALLARAEKAEQARRAVA